MGKTLEQIMGDVHFIFGYSSVCSHVVLLFSYLGKMKCAFLVNTLEICGLKVLDDACVLLPLFLGES